MVLDNKKAKEALQALYEASLEALKAIEENDIINTEDFDYTLPLDFEELPRHIAYMLEQLNV